MFAPLLIQTCKDVLFSRTLDSRENWWFSFAIIKVLLVGRWFLMFSLVYHCITTLLMDSLNTGIVYLDSIENGIWKTQIHI